MTDEENNKVEMIVKIRFIYSVYLKLNLTFNISEKGRSDVV